MHEGKIQHITPFCYICKYYNTSVMIKDDGWCSHKKINGRHFPISCAKAGVQPDCPFIKDKKWITSHWLLKMEIEFLKVSLDIVLKLLLFIIPFVYLKHKIEIKKKRSL